MGVFVAYFGELKQDYCTWRVNGSKDELKHLLGELVKEKAAFYGGVVPQIEHIQKNEYTLLLELKITNKGAAANAYKTHPPNGKDSKQKIY